MRPPICYVCGNRDDRHMGLVGFADYRSLERGIVGHPNGLEWFCSAHQKQAQALAHLPLEEAVRIIRAREGRWWKKWLAVVWTRC